MGAIETIRWLGDCLHEDRARRGVRDFTSGKVEVRKFMAGTELLATDDLPSEVVGAAYGKRMSQKLATHGRRRETVYGTLFLTGRFMNKTWCAPALLYPALVTRDGVGEIEVAHWKLNPVLRDELDFDEEFEGGLESLLGNGILTVRLVRRLGARLQKSLPGLDVAPLGKFPHLARAGDLDERKSKKGMALVSASAFGLLERSRGVAGVLHELKELAESPSSWSRPLEVFMGLRKEKAAESTNRVDQVPAVLSGAQERIVRSARKNALTLCHGPPGTGKSFTISAIAIDHIARGESVLIGKGSCGRCGGGKNPSHDGRSRGDGAGWSQRIPSEVEAIH